jgi:hypothetical protein
MGAVILLLTLSVGALSSVADDGQPTAARLTILPPTTAAEPPTMALLVPSTTVPVPTTTATPVTSAPRPTAAPTSAVTALTPPTTRPPRFGGDNTGKALAITPASGTPGSGISLRGLVADCPATATSVIAVLRTSDRRGVNASAPGGGTYVAGGEWTTSVGVPLDSVPGVYKVTARCYDPSGMPVASPYADATFTVIAF